jgi:hypothetical protein
MWPVLLLTLFTGVLTAVGFVCAIGWVFTIPLGIVTNVVAYNEYYLRKAV